MAIGTIPGRAAPGAPDTRGVKAAAPDIVALVRQRPVRRLVRPRPVPRVPYLVADPNRDRGFYDPGYAYHGNVNGCVIDQGYGRYAPCFGGH